MTKITIRPARMVAIVFFIASVLAAASPSYAARPPKLFKQIDISPYKGSHLSPGDLNNDGKIDFVLYRNVQYTTPGYIVAIDSDGRKLWEIGNPTITKHCPTGGGKEPPLRGICLVYDIDRDGQSEVITELWVGGVYGKPMMYVLDGATGKIEASRQSPFDLSVRDPISAAETEWHRTGRSHPVGLIAHLKGPDGPPAIILKYGSSNQLPCHAFALNSSLDTIWHVAAGKHSMGHIVTVADFDNDGRDEVVLGHIAVDEEGNVIIAKDFPAHADCTDVADLIPGDGKEILISECRVGPVYCLSSDTGDIIWQKTKAEVPHGQGVWAGNFIADEPGLEVIVLKSGHVGDFFTLRGTDGAVLAEFKQKYYKQYPDFPAVVNWTSRKVQGLWIPQDRAIVDGRGNVLMDLGAYKEKIDKLFRMAEEAKLEQKSRHIAAQAFALDLCGDERDELVVYQPYDGTAILIFTQPDSDGREKPYIHQKNAHNFRSYF